MSNAIVKERHFFSLHEYEEEEKLLREKSKAGLKLVGIKCGMSYSFEKTTPEDVVYRLYFKQLKKSEM